MAHIVRSTVGRNESASFYQTKLFYSHFVSASGLVFQVIHYILQRLFWCTYLNLFFELLNLQMGLGMKCVPFDNMLIVYIKNYMHHWSIAICDYWSCFRFQIIYTYFHLLQILLWPFLDFVILAMRCNTMYYICYFPPFPLVMGSNSVSQRHSAVTYFSDRLAVRSFSSN